MSTLEINVACAVEGVPEAVYHADPVQGGSLSYTGMKELLKSPAHYRHYIDQPRVEKKVFDEGTIIHSLVLGSDLPVVELPFTDYRTKAAREARDDVYAAGLIPVKEGELDPLREIAEAVLAHPTARTLFEHDGPTELSMFAPDPTTSVWLRGRADKISQWEGETVLVDLKTTPDADPSEFNRKGVAGLGYYLQAYVYGWLYEQTKADAPRPEMLFVAVSKNRPHLVSVNRLHPAYDDLGRMAMRRALEIYQACTVFDSWPGYGDNVHELQPPMWLTHSIQTQEGDY